jgi:hypothetical protein
MPVKLSITDKLHMPKCAAQIPRLGFGVYRSSTSQCIESCTTALKVGYRTIDTAQFYENEAEVGAAVRQSGLKRDDVFITTKILSAGGSFAKSLQKCIDSVDKIDGKEGYVDCFLIHSPNGGKEKRKEMWQALEKLYEIGKAKSIGVSNYGIGHIEEMKAYAKVWPPHVNQIELHPWCQQREIVEYCKKNKMVVEAYCPLVRNYKANDETLVGIAKKYGKTTGQILIRYCLQKGWVPLPKSDNPERIAQNADVFGFDISKEDMATLDGLDQGSSGAIVEAVDNK